MMDRARGSGAIGFTDDFVSGVFVNVANAMLPPIGKEASQGSTKIRSWVGTQNRQKMFRLPGTPLS
jgi:hypothetical protein